MDRAVLKLSVIRACQGDIDALGRLYHHYFDKMVWLAYAVLLDLEQAEEVAQQSFVIACEKLDNLQNPGCFGG